MEIKNKAMDDEIQKLIKLKLAVKNLNSTLTGNVTLCGAGSLMVLDKTEFNLISRVLTVAD